MGFPEKIEKQLESLSKEQLRLFTWLCAVRALPFLSAMRKFTYWPEDKRLRGHLEIKHLKIRYKNT